MEELSRDASARRCASRGEPVPTLAEVLDMLGDLELNVEIKVEPAGRAWARSSRRPRR